MSKEFLDQYNPEFCSKFGKDKSKLSLKLYDDRHPRIIELIDQLGISSQLAYNDQNSAVDHEYLTDKFMNDDIIEEKKVDDIIAAFMEASADLIGANKAEMSKLYQNSYNHLDVARRPIVSIMMWGKQSKLASYPASQEVCKLEEYSWNQLVLDGKLHNCVNFSDENYV